MKINLGIQKYRAAVDAPPSNTAGWPLATRIGHTHPIGHPCKCLIADRLRAYESSRLRDVLQFDFDDSCMQHRKWDTRQILVTCRCTNNK